MTVLTNKRVALWLVLSVGLIALVALALTTVGSPIGAHGGYGKFGGGASLNRYVDAGVITQEEADEISAWKDNSPDVYSDLKNRIREAIADGTYVRSLLSDDIAEAIAADLSLDVGDVTRAYEEARQAVADGTVPRFRIISTWAAALEVSAVELVSSLYTARVAVYEAYQALSTVEKLQDRFGKLHASGIVTDSELAELNEWAGDAPEALDEFYGTRSLRGFGYERGSGRSFGTSGKFGVSAWI